MAMNIWHIAVKEIRSNLRDTRTFLFMLAFPIVMMLILGTALSNAFGSSSNVGELQLLVKQQTSNTQLAAAWDGFAESLGREGVKINRAEPGVDGREEVRTDRYTAYAEVGDDGIRFYGSSKNTVESDILQGMLTAFAGRYSLVSAAYGIDPASAPALASGAGP